jgi:hypothetical protein
LAEVKIQEVSDLETPNVPYPTVGSLKIQKYMLTPHPKAASSKSPNNLQFFSLNP